MDLTIKRKGLVNGIRFEIKDSFTIRVWKPDDVPFHDFKERCDLVVKYLIDEAVFDKKNCKVEVVT